MKAINARCSDTITPQKLNEQPKSPEDILLDVRTPAEFASGHIPGATSVPLGDLNAPDFLRRHDGCNRLYVICQTGNRARKAIEAFEKQGFARCVLLEGGMEGWTAAGLAVESQGGTGISVMRQVQLIIGSATAFGALLALIIDPWFALIPLVSGSGLVISGATGWCGLALLLSKMPWNRITGSKSTACCSSKLPIKQ